MCNRMGTLLNYLMKSLCEGTGLSFSMPRNILSFKKAWWIFSILSNQVLIYKYLFYTFKDITRAKLFSEISFSGLFSAPWLLSHL